MEASENQEAPDVVRWMLYELGVFDSTDVKRMLHYLMTSPIIRGFWKRASSRGR